jgi:hypothetical protein
VMGLDFSVPVHNWGPKHMVYAWVRHEAVMPMLFFTTWTLVSLAISNA